jgi:glycolate oxidase FAD binding subunit
MATPTDTGTLEAALRSTRAAVSTETEAYAVDGQTPSYVVHATGLEDVTAVLRATDRSGSAVTPWGSGSRQALGMPPSRYDVALDLRALNRIVEYEPADLTVTVQAGMLLSELQRVLADKGQWLPLDPPDGTIGGILATNASGPARMKHGTARDLVIGMQVVSPQGDVLKSGGRVVKNVAGYDMAKLHIGALGTLGVISQATFKVAPLPKVTRTVTMSGELSNLMSTSLLIRNRGWAVGGLILAGPPWQLSIRLEGGAAAVERTQRELEALGPLTESEALDSAEEALVIARLSTGPTLVVAACEALATAGARVTAYPTAGVLRGRWSGSPDVAALEAVRRDAEAAGGAFVLEAAPVELKQRFDVWGALPPAFELMRRLKQQFDPNRTLNPGRFVGGL